MRHTPMVLFLVAAGCSEAPMPGQADWTGMAKRFDPVRLVSWNIETVGSPGSVEYNAALAVLARLDADVVALQEVATLADQANLLAFANDAGYPEVAIGWPVAFGYDHSAVLSRRTLLDVQVMDAASLSPDPTANDLTRSFLRVEVQTAADPLIVVTNHWKSGSSDVDEFRRALESHRAVAALDGLDPAVDPIIVFGDVNEDPADLPLSPAAFFAKPLGLPGAFWVGQDLYDQMVQVGIPNNPLAPLQDFGLTGLVARQRDGSRVTFPSSGRSLDHAFVSPALKLGGVEIFDDADEALASTLHLSTQAIAVGTVLAGSDHLPLVVEVGVQR